MPYKRKSKSLTKKKVKPRVPRTRNSESMTEAQFWGWFRSGLRRMSMRWKPPSELYKENKIPVKGKRHRFEYKCANCGRQFKKTDTHADHIIPSGSLKSFEDLSSFAERLFVEKDGYQILCNYKLEDAEKHGGIPSCHYIKTQEERKQSRKK